MTVSHIIFIFIISYELLNFKNMGTHFQSPCIIIKYFIKKENDKEKLYKVKIKLIPSLKIFLSNIFTRE